MIDSKKSIESPTKDYKERFEFVLTVAGNIICQRYFKITGFQPSSLRSYNLTDAVRRCVATIDNDLKDKSQVYLEIFAPQVFESVEEMEAFVANPENSGRLRPGMGIVVRGSENTDYTYTKDGGVKALGYKFDDGELTSTGIEETKATYRFAFKVDGREACAMEWDGYYPSFVRDKKRIDLSNKRGKFDEEEVSRLSSEQYLLYKMFEGKTDLIYGLIKNLCQACITKEQITEPDEMLECWNGTSMAILYHVHDKSKKIND